MLNRSAEPKSRPSPESAHQGCGLKLLVDAVRNSWPSAAVIAGLSALVILLVLGTRVSGNPGAAGYYTPVAASFGALYSVSAFVVLALFCKREPRRLSPSLNAVVCALIVACSVFQSVSGSSRSLLLYIACFVEIGCLAIWLLFAGNMPTAGKMLDGCVIVALSCLMTLGFLVVNYLVTFHVGIPIALPIAPLTVCLCLHKYGRRFREQDAGHLPGVEKPRFTGLLPVIASASLGLAFSCLFSLLLRFWLNANTLNAFVLVPLCCGCVLATVLMVLTGQRVSVCLAAPPLLCISAALTGALAPVGQQSMPTFQLAFFTAGAVCAVFALASALPSLCASASSAQPGELGAINVLSAFAACFLVPTLEVVGALLNDGKILGQMGLAALIVYGASCCMLRIAASEVFGIPPSGESRPRAVGMVAKEYGLTAREADVLEELFNGRTAPYIARNLSVSINTVRSHVKRVYAKLSVHSQQELIDLIETDMSQRENNRP